MTGAQMLKTAVEAMNDATRAGAAVDAVPRRVADCERRALGGRLRVIDATDRPGRTVAADSGATDDGRSVDEHLAAMLRQSLTTHLAALERVQGSSGATSHDALKSGLAALDGMAGTQGAERIRRHLARADQAPST